MSFILCYFSLWKEKTPPPPWSKRRGTSLVLSKPLPAFGLLYLIRQFSVSNLNQIRFRNSSFYLAATRWWRESGASDTGHKKWFGRRPSGFRLPFPPWHGSWGLWAGERALRGVCGKPTWKGYVVPLAGARSGSENRSVTRCLRCGFLRRSISF